MTRIEIRQHRSAIGEKPGAKQTLSALGLRRTGQVVSHEDSATVRGMLRRVAHLVVITDAKDGKGKKSERAKAVGTLLGERAKAKGIETAVFDRGGYRYHGRIKALGDGARSAGLRF